MDVILEVTQPQRVAVLCLAVLVNMAVSALFFGVHRSNIGQTALAGIVGAVRRFVSLLFVVPLDNWAQTCHQCVCLHALFVLNSSDCHDPF